jgi:hypothetical protein
VDEPHTVERVCSTSLRIISHPYQDPTMKLTDGGSIDK